LGDNKAWGNLRLPFEINRSNAVTAEALKSLYLTSERGQQGAFPLGAAAYFHSGADLMVERNKTICSVAHGEVVAARIGVGPGEHPWGDTGFVLLRHPLQGNKSLYSLYVHLQREPLHPDRTQAGWLQRLLLDGMAAAGKTRWRVTADVPTWKDEDKGRFSPDNMQRDKLLKAGVYDEEDRTTDGLYLNLKGVWVKIAENGTPKVKELSPWSEFDLETAAKKSQIIGALKDGKVAILDADKAGGKHRWTAEAGEPIGRAGTYLGIPLVHWSVFSKDAVLPTGSLPDKEFGASDEVKVKELVLSEERGDVTHTEKLIEALDPKKKNVGKMPHAIPQPGEVQHFYRTPAECWRSRYLAVKGLTEFALDVDKFLQQERYKSHTNQERDEFKRNAQIFLFWKELAQADDFPKDGKAIFFHPATAVRLMQPLPGAQQDFEYTLSSKILKGDVLADWMKDKASSPLDARTAKPAQVAQLRKALRRLGNLSVQVGNDWRGLGNDVKRFQHEQLGDQKTLNERLDTLAGGKGAGSKLVLKETGTVDRLTAALLDLALREEYEKPNAQVVRDFASCALIDGPLVEWMRDSNSEPLNADNATPAQIKRIRLALFWWGDREVARKDSWGQLGDDVLKFQKEQLKDKTKLKSALQSLHVQGDERVLKLHGEIDRLTAALLDLALVNQVEQPQALLPPPLYDKENLDLKGDDPRIRHLQQCLVALGYATERELGDERRSQAGDRPNTNFVLIDLQFDWEAGADGQYGAGTMQKMKAALHRGADGALPLPPKMAGESGGSAQDLNYPGGDDFITKKGTRIHNTSGKVQFVASSKKAIADAWDTLVTGPHCHNDPEQMADVNSSSKGYPKDEMNQVDTGTVVQVYGPGVPFRVARKFLAGGIGGVVCAIVRDRKVRLWFCHLTEISTEVYKAAKDHTELPEGTHLGATTNLIGLTTGQHLHLQADELLTGRMMQRSKFLPKLRQTETALSTDNPPCPPEPS
jgi:hypothetical protein